jgi:hypothetical protein
MTPNKGSRGLGFKGPSERNLKKLESMTPGTPGSSSKIWGVKV